MVVKVWIVLPVKSFTLNLCFLLLLPLTGILGAPPGLKLGKGWEVSGMDTCSC